MVSILGRRYENTVHEQGTLPLRSVVSVMGIFNSTRLRAISRMKTRCLLIFVVMEAVLLVCAGAESLAQVNPSSETPEQHVLLSKLSPPIYPPLARQARISGDVDLELRIRQDGSIESAQAVSGHPMLKEAALDSAKKSEFECRSCQGLKILTHLHFRTLDGRELLQID
jgi:TonB family protein